MRVVLVLAHSVTQNAHSNAGTLALAGSSWFKFPVITRHRHRHRRPPPPSLMASPKLSGLSALLLLVILLIVVVAEPVVAFQLEADDTISHFPPLLDCGPASAAPSSAFRANVLSLLDALPAAAAAAPTGFAAARSRGAAGRDRSFARGLCFGYSGRDPSPAGDDCLACLSAAAADVGASCNGSRRGGTWRAGCFLSYADTNATSAREDAFRGWFYDGDSGPTPAAALGSQCLAADLAPSAECTWCLDESARVVPELKRRHRLSQIHGDAVVVVGYSCYLRVMLEAPLPRWRVYADEVLAIVEIVVLALVEVWGILFCIRRAGQMNPNPA